MSRAQHEFATSSNHRRKAVEVVEAVEVVATRQSAERYLNSPRPRFHPALPASRRSSRRGAVLLEVVLALALFVAAAAIIGTSLSASVATVDRLRWETLASNLAASTIAELELGLLPLLPSSSAPFEPPFEEWTWELIPGEASRDTASGAFPLQRVEVVIRHVLEPVVFRLAQWLPVGTNSLNAPFLYPEGAAAPGTSLNPASESAFP